MNKRLISATTALAIAAAGGFAYAQTGTAQEADRNGVPGVEMNVGDNARNDGGLPGVEANIGADGDQKNIDTNTLGAGSADMNSDTSTLGAGNDTDLSQPRADRN